MDSPRVKLASRVKCRSRSDRWRSRAACRVTLAWRTRDARELCIYAMWNELKWLLTRMTRDACRSRDARVLCVLGYKKHHLKQSRRAWFFKQIFHWQTTTTLYQRWINVTDVDSTLIHRRMPTYIWRTTAANLCCLNPKSTFLMWSQHNSPSLYIKI